MAKGKKKDKKNKLENNEKETQVIGENKKTKNKNHKKFNVKKNLGRLVALIIVLCILLASSATLIFYLMWYLK